MNVTLLASPFLWKEESDGAGGGNPDPSDGDNKDEKPITLTKKELDELISSKMRGPGKALEAANAKLAAYEEAEKERKAKADEARRKKLEADGNVKALLAERDQEVTKLRETLTSLQEREMARLEALADANDKRAKKLPKNLQELIPQGLDADQVREQLDRLERLSPDSKRNVHGGGGRTTEPDDPMEKYKAGVLPGTRGGVNK